MHLGPQDTGSQTRSGARSCARDELDSAMRTIAHELRSPLVTLLGYAELIEGDPALAGRVVQSGRRMVEQVDALLGLLRITERPIDPVPVDLSAIGRAVADQLARRTGDRLIEMRIEDGLSAVADPELAYLVLEHLLGNAVEHTRGEPQARIELRGVDRDASFRTFVVRDNGDGFPAEDADRLFHPTARRHGDQDRTGTGVGLASVARIVGLHGGAVAAEGEEHVGAAFYFSLPVSG